LALLISGVAVARALIAEGVEPLAAAGLSAGAFSAAVISGALKFTDGLGLIRQRAEMMTGLFPQGFGVSAIVGLTEEQVREIIRQTDSRHHPPFVANINAPRQIAISGSIEAMEKALELARHRGARKAVRLGVSVPSHCPLLEPVADSRAALAGMDLRAQNPQSATSPEGLCEMLNIAGHRRKCRSHDSVARRHHGAERTWLSNVPRNASRSCPD
jgi:malonate decarboxylase epsilon subunit